MMDSKPPPTTWSTLKGHKGRWPLQTPPPAKYRSFDPESVGRRYGFVEVVSPLVLWVRGRCPYIAVRCTGCGYEQWIYRYSLTSGKSKGCQACSQPRQIPAWLTRVLNAAQQRCENPRAKNYHNYGARGIRFCFPSVLEAGLWVMVNLGHRPPKMTLDRKDNNRNYEAGNLRWATQRQQTSNTRRALQWTFQGKPIIREHALHVIRALRPNTTYADQTIRRFVREAGTVEATLVRIDNAPPSCKPRGLYGIFSTPDPAIVSLYLTG